MRLEEMSRLLTKLRKDVSQLIDAQLPPTQRTNYPATIIRWTGPGTLGGTVDTSGVGKVDFVSGITIEKVDNDILEVTGTGGGGTGVVAYTWFVSEFLVNGDLGLQPELKADDTFTEIIATTDVVTWYDVTAEIRLEGVLIGTITIPTGADRANTAITSVTGNKYDRLIVTITSDGGQNLTIELIGS